MNVVIGVLGASYGDSYDEEREHAAHSFLVLTERVVPPGFARAHLLRPLPPQVPSTLEALVRAIEALRRHPRCEPHGSTQMHVRCDVLCRLADVPGGGIAVTVHAVDDCHAASRSALLLYPVSLPTLPTQSLYRAGH
eukprot:3403494-Rhodomonas_salina.1